MSMIICDFRDGETKTGKLFPQSQIKTKIRMQHLLICSTCPHPVHAHTYTTGIFQENKAITLTR